MRLCEGRRDLWVLPLEGERKPRQFLPTPFLEGSAVFSPDGNWLAYASNESGQHELYVRPYAGGGGNWQVSSGGGTEPSWPRNRDELFYRNGNQMMVVEVIIQPNFSAGSSRILFEEQYAPMSMRRANYDVSPDSQRFLMIRAPDQQQDALGQINVVLNWFEELKRRVPTNQ